MKKLFLLTLFCVTLGMAYYSVPIPRPHMLGYYTWNGTIWCTDHESCLHEVGHMLDDKAGWISASPEYLAVLEAYTPLDVRMPDGQPDRTALMEFYAQAFEFTGGMPDRMPVQFRDFYDWQKASVLIQEYAP